VRRLLADLDSQTAKRKASAVVSNRAARSKSKVTARSATRAISQASRPELVPRKTRKSLAQGHKTESIVEKSAKSHEAIFAAVPIAPPASVIPREPDNQNAEPRVRVHPGKKLPSKRTVPPLKSSVKSSALALGGTIPPGPIVVSAQQIRIEHSLRQQEAIVRRDHFSSPSATPLTAELLTQRWIQGFQSSAR
jgi:hypothetical protein